MRLSELLKAYREEHGLSQRQFASMCDLSNGYISLLEGEVNPKTGKPITPTLPQLAKIAEGMRMTLSELLSSIDDIPVNLCSDNVSAHPILSADELHMVNMYQQLNNDGRQKAAEYIEDLTGNEKYKRESELFEQINIL